MALTPRQMRRPTTLRANLLKNGTVALREFDGREESVSDPGISSQEPVTEEDEIVSPSSSDELPAMGQPSTPRSKSLHDQVRGRPFFASTREDSPREAAPHRLYPVVEGCDVPPRVNEWTPLSADGHGMLSSDDLHESADGISVILLCASSYRETTEMEQKPYGWSIGARFGPSPPLYSSDTSCSNTKKST
uniref:Uncharacterized protein n=1 Tax=Compsopogon caeruleus TaxID=31354 RepID=A0A7S1XAG8_9RHOD|mmetsp:Transcript_11647/g.23684  ORF Transcript_11647/g.23684 Transcript_11647/m.23684 type:complete len:191 (+) Transcript_11647:193-765(+)